MNFPIIKPAINSGRELGWRIALGCFPLLAILFLVYPQLDITISQLFWQPQQGFWGEQLALFSWVHKYIRVVVGLSLLVILAAWLLSCWNRAPQWLLPHRKSLSYLLLALLLGPGLMVNVLFKDQWGRARPHQVVDFGGDKHFTPAWIVSDQCGHNCSFVCGDASVGFVLLAGIFISRRPRRWFFASLLVGSFLGFMRVAQGGHFFSDVIFSWYVVAASVWLLAYWRNLYQRRMRGLPANFNPSEQNLVVR
jgi:lipid A 4'-phosphatase